MPAAAFPGNPLAAFLAAALARSRWDSPPCLWAIRAGDVPLLQPLPFPGLEEGESAGDVLDRVAGTVEDIASGPRQRPQRPAPYGTVFRHELWLMIPPDEAAREGLVPAGTFSPYPDRVEARVMHSVTGNGAWTVFQSRTFPESLPAAVPGSGTQFGGPRIPAALARIHTALVRRPGRGPDAPGL